MILEVIRKGFSGIEQRKVGNFELNKRLCRINRIFADNGWLNTASSQVAINHALDKCVEIAMSAPDDEFELFCNLLRKYTLFQFEWYIPAFERVLDKIEPSEECGHVYNLVPLLAPKDENKSKSGNSLLYSFANTVWSRSRKFGRHPLRTFARIKELENAKTDNSNATLFVIDDFIGSGDTALEFANSSNIVMNSHNRVVFVALAAMKSGISAINKLGYDVEYDIIINKGIADCSEMKGEERFYKIMEVIESRIDMDERFKFGYKESEALVTMQRTPNNTFPFFWAAQLKGGQRCPSLFPRL